jgi:hypothetical protein
MSDGRAFTDYRPKGQQAIEDLVPLGKGSYDMLHYLERNGETLKDERRVETYNNNVCASCASHNFHAEVDEVRCNANTCGVAPTPTLCDDGGDKFGRGRDYAIQEPYNGKATPGSGGWPAPHLRGTVQYKVEPPCPRPVDPFNPFDFAVNLSERLPSPLG